MNKLLAITLLVVASMPLSAVGEQESPTVPPGPTEPVTLSVVVATGTPGQDAQPTRGRPDHA